MLRGGLRSASAGARLHLEEMQAAGLAFPKPTAHGKYVEVPA
jgi:hypothetical protein